MCFRFRDHGVGITKDDYLKFFHLLNNINDVDTALTFYHIAGASIDQPTLRHVARTVAHVDLHPHLINVVFTIFDENSGYHYTYKQLNVARYVTKTYVFMKPSQKSNTRVATCLC